MQIPSAEGTGATGAGAGATGAGATGAGAGATGAGAGATGAVFVPHFVQKAEPGANCAPHAVHT